MVNINNIFFLHNKYLVNINNMVNIVIWWYMVNKMSYNNVGYDTYGDM